MCDCNGTVYEELRGRMTRKKRRQAQQLERIKNELMERMKVEQGAQQMQPMPTYDSTNAVRLGVNKESVANPFSIVTGNYSPNVMNQSKPYYNAPVGTNTAMNPMLLDAQRQMEIRQQQAILDIAGSGGYNSPGVMMLTNADAATDEDYPPIAIADGPDMYDRFFSDYTGCQPGEKPRDCRKRIKVEGRAQSGIAKSEAKRLKAEAKALLAEQGIAGGGGGNKAGKILKGIGDAAGGILGGIFGKKGGSEGEGEGGGNYAANASTSGASSSKTTTYIIIGVVAVIVIGGIAFVMMRKK